MILNMTGGGNQAQIIDVTLTSETTGANIDIVIPGIVLPGETVNGFMFYPISNIAESQNGCIYYVWYNTTLGSKLGLKYHIFDETRFSESIRTNVWVYDSTDRTLTLKVNDIQYWLYPGNYKLVIW